MGSGKRCFHQGVCQGGVLPVAELGWGGKESRESRSEQGTSVSSTSVTRKCSVVTSLGTVDRARGWVWDV